MPSDEEPGAITPAVTDGQPSSTAPAPGEEPPSRSRSRRTFSGSRELWWIVYRDPEHLAERLTLYAADRLGDPSRTWAESVRSARPKTHWAQIAEELRTESAHLARIDGAIAGTPFFLALVPGCLSYLLQEMRMTLRTAALYGRDPRALRTSAGMLALRGVHPDVDSARAALTSVRDRGTPDRPAQRRPWRTWVHGAYSLLVFGGFMSPSTAEEQARGKLREAVSVLVGVAIWVTTWVLPITSMIAMARGCETHARKLGRRTLFYYGGGADSVLDAIKGADQRHDRGHDTRTIVRTAALSLSIAVPVGFVAYADHVRNTIGVNRLGALGTLGTLVALSLVIATAVIASRK